MLASHSMRAAVLGLILAASAAEAQVPNRWLRDWPNTDFSTAIVDLSEIFSGGPGKDGIPAIHAPTFTPVDQAKLEDREPVIALEVNGAARAYPLRYLMWHEIVNDTLGGVPVAATFCPLCNAAISFDRRVNGRTLSFGVSGMLRHSDMIMYDRETESWWQQFTGEAIAGELVGDTLTFLPSELLSWAEFRELRPNGEVMAQPQGYLRAYGANPYVRYDSAERPFLYRGEVPPHGVAPLARVVRVGDRAWPLSRLAEAGELIEDGVRLTWRAGQASALDTRDLAEGRDVGSVRVFDAATGEPLVHDLVFAFAFHAFVPEGRWMMGR